MKLAARVMLVGVLTFVLVSGSVLAQGEQIYCNGLSDDDCQLLKDSIAAMQSVESVSIPAWSFNLDMDLPDEPTHVAVSGSGVFMVPPGAVALMSDLPPVDSPDFAAALLNQIDVDWFEQMLSEAVMQFAVDELVAEPSDGLDEISFAIIIKDDTFYMHSTSPTGADMWFGQPIEFALADREEFQDALDEWREMLAGAEMDAATETFDDLAEFEGQFDDLAAKHITTTRGADQTVDGQTIAVFTTSFDLAGYLTDPDLPALLLELLQQPVFADMDAEVREMNETQIQFLLSTVAMIVTNSTITSEQWIGVDDQFIRKAQANITIEIDTSLFGGSDAAKTSAITITMGYAVEMADFNAVDPDSVEVPPSFENLDAADNFLVGTPDMIEGQIALDEPVSGAFDEDNDKDVYEVALAAGDAIAISIESDGDLYIKLYGPDGFMVAEYDPYMSKDKILAYMAENAGDYVVVVEGYWTDYILTVSAAS